MSRGVRVDLHLHTTASDGRSTPEELVEQAAAGGVTVMAVTDHDTTAAVAAVKRAAAARGITAISGIEITAVDNGRDVHVLGYFLREDDEALNAFLREQREKRIARVEAIAKRLDALGVPIDVGPLVAVAREQNGRSIGRPQVAHAMIAAGHVADLKEAFDRWLSNDGPAFVAREGATPEVVIDVIHRAGGVASLAHPGKTGIDARIEALAAAGLDALEAFHPDHEPEHVERYTRMAERLNLMLTAGSDFHGEPVHGRTPGVVTLPPEHWARLSDGRL